MTGWVILSILYAAPVVSDTLPNDRIFVTHID